ncbi:asparagine synthetase B family protein [Emticicia sp. BO119]|uniref:asparagine synthase-related protein n=1 Tax=Emticicia sp. BO119 TaxID=2757768 RepID=UPI0015EFE667|nr:asparagine synthetase B family protein [Emticicia sp. BO119]MBA4853989.1 hypothetical protein [Emticicia sp. BO119]
MSLIFGIVKHNDNQNDEGLLQKMYTPLKNFPQVRFDKISIQEASFGKILNYGTPEDIFDSQPVYLSEQNILFTALGRLDNREVLSEDLGLKENEAVSDTYFMLQAYLKYGEEVQHKLKGEWNLVVYNYNTKELFITRDTMGYTALYFYNTDKYFAFSTSVKSILALPYFKKELNEEYFVSALTLWKIDDKFFGNETFYKNIFFLKGGHSIKQKNGEININKYWPPENIKEVRYKNKQDYADQMSELMYKAVKVRLRSYKPVSATLSGGLDSSMVAYIAADLLKQQGKTLTTHSHVPLFKQELLNTPFASKVLIDETPFIEATARASGNINPKYLNSESTSPGKGMIEIMDVLDGFIHAAWNAYWVLDIYRTCAQKGYGVVLTGEGGNGSTSFSAVDYLLPHNLQRFIKQPVSYLKRQIAKQFVTKYFNARPKFNPLIDYIANGYVNSEVLSKYSINVEIKKNNNGLLKYYKNVLELKKQFINMYHLRGLFGKSFGSYYGIELRDPTVDIDVMNFFLAIPNDVFFDDDYNGRMLVKMMMKNKTPDEVLYARKKGLQSSDIFFRAQKSKEEFFEELSYFKNSNLVDSLININKIENNLNLYFNTDNIESPEKIQLLLKNIQAASFLRSRF